jgi:hypothetical protein
MTTRVPVVDSVVNRAAAPRARAQGTPDGLGASVPGLAPVQREIARPLATIG